VADTCRAGVFTGDGRHEIREFAVPDPPDGGAVLRVEAVGLCGSDVAQHAGAHLIPGNSAFPVVPGHETVGRVWRLGRGADLGVREGDRVAVDEVLSVDGPITVYGYTMPVDDGGGLFGGYGEYMVVLPGTRLHRLPDDRPAYELTVFEPLANAVNWVELAGVSEGQTVVVEGPGHQGLAVLEAVLAAGVARAIVTGTADDGLRLDAARAIGAHETIDVGSVDAVTRVRELTEGRMADVVLDVSPAVETVRTALDLVAFRGTILLAGLKKFAPVDGLVTDRIVVQGLRVLGGSGYTPDSMTAAVDLIATGAVDVGPLRGEAFGLDRLDEALGLLARTIPGRDAVRVSLVHDA
jgi:threonine dehydrogenase-like Zn-dependent dehydrogenase